MILFENEANWNNLWEASIFLDQIVQGDIQNNKFVKIYTTYS